MNRKAGLLFILAGPVIGGFSALFGLLLHATKVWFQLGMLLGGYPCILTGLLILLGLFDDFEYQAACILYFGTLLGGGWIGKMLYGDSFTMYCLAFALSLAITLAVYFKRKADKAKEE